MEAAPTTPTEPTHDHSGRSLVTHVLIRFSGTFAVLALVAAGTSYLLTQGAVTDERMAAHEAQATIIAGHVLSALADGDVPAAEDLANSAVRFSNTALRDIHVFNASGAPVLSTSGAASAPTFSGGADMQAEVLDDAAIVSVPAVALGLATTDRVELVFANASGVGFAGIGSALFFLVAAAAACGALAWLLGRDVKGPLKDTVRALDDLVEGRDTQDWPAAAGVEVFALMGKIAQLRGEVSHLRNGKVSDDNSSDREESEVALRLQAIELELKAERERLQAVKADAEAQAAEHSKLEDDICDFIASANDGHFTARLDVTGCPRSQAQVRNMLNGLVEQIGKSVDDVAATLSELGEGRLSARIKGHRTGVFSQLQERTNAMAARLEAAFDDLSRHATGMLDDTSDLSASAEDLSKRTERTAGSLAETTTALDQIVGSISSTADLTAQARGFAESAREDARQSDVIVRDAVQAMQEIQSVSEEISKTLGVINDIAFQTNLLALNAGVEAARAGEAGRGFAVVASEVRALAQRASDAAQLIGQLIATSSEQIDKGVQRVARTGETLANLGERIERIGDQVSDIAHSAEAQSGAAAEISRAMSEIDGATQQNTAMFEEITTANLSLKGAASEMLRLIERFDADGATAEQAAWSGQPAPSASSSYSSAAVSGGDDNATDSWSMSDVAWSESQSGQAAAGHDTRA